MIFMRRCLKYPPHYANLQLVTYILQYASRRAAARHDGSRCAVCRVPARDARPSCAAGSAAPFPTIGRQAAAEACTYDHTPSAPYFILVLMHGSSSHAFLRRAGGVFLQPVRTKAGPYCDPWRAGRNRIAAEDGTGHEEQSNMYQP